MGVLENINIHDGSGNTLTSTSNALDVNLKTSAATVTVAQPTGTNLHTVLDSGTLTSITDAVTVVQPTASSLNATVRNQDGAGNPLTSTGDALDSNLKTIGGTAVQTGTGTSGAGIPRVTVSNDSKVQPWDGTNSAKFDATGETTADITRFGGTSVTIGQKVMASSMPIVIASDQSPIPVSGVFNIQGGTTQSGNIPNTLNGTLVIVDNDFIWSTLTLNFIAPPPNSSPVLSLGGEFQLEGSIDNVNWTALTGTLLSDTPTQVTQYTTTGFLSCAARYNLAGFPWIRIRTTNPFTGTISVQQALTTALGDEVSFTTSRIVDDSGHTVDLTPAAQYTEGQIPSAVYFQGGFAVLPTFPDTQIIDPALATFVLPKRSQIGNTLVVSVVLQGTGLTAANLASQAAINGTPAGTPYVWLADTAGNSYTPLGFYDSTVTSSGQAILVYVRTINAVDDEGQLGFLVGWGGEPFGTGTGQDPATVTGITLLAQEYSGVQVTGESIAHAVAPSTTLETSVSAPIAPSPGSLVYNLLSTVMPSGSTAVLGSSIGEHTNTGAAGFAGSSAQCSTVDNLSSFSWPGGLNASLDWVCVKLPVVTTGMVMMGRPIGTNGPMQAIRIDPTSGGLLAAVTNDPLSPLSVQVTNPLTISNSGSTFPVQLQDGEGNLLSSFEGALNVNFSNLNFPDPLAVTQSGTWTVTDNNPSIGVVGGTAPGHATAISVLSSVNGTLESPVIDANSGLRVNIAAGSASTNPAASATGTSLPADASYTGLNIGGNLVGQTGLSLTNAKAAAVAIVDASGNQLGATSGSLNVNVTNPGLQNPAASFIGNTTPQYASYTGFNSGNDLVGVSSTNPLPVAVSGTSTVSISGTPAVSITGTPAVTVSGTVTAKNQDGAGNNLTSTSGALNVNITGGSTSGTQYAAGTAVATPTGTVSLGTDGTDVRVLSTTTTGALNVVAAPVAITGANGAAVEAAQGAGAPAHVLQVGGVFNTTPAPVSSGDITALQTDINGSLKVTLAGSTVTPLVQIQSSGTNLTNTSGALNVNLQSSGTTLTNTSGALNVNVTNSPSGSNTAASATGSAVPTSAGYTGVNTNGTLTGLMGFTDQGAAGTTGTQNGIMGMMLQETGGNFAWAQRCDTKGSLIVTEAPSTLAACALSSKFINATGAAASVKATAGNLYGFTLTNATASPAYVEFFNVATAPTLGTTAVVFCVVIPASGNVTISPNVALMNFTTGIGFAVTTAENGATTAAVTGMIFYQ